MNRLLFIGFCFCALLCSCEKTEYYYLSQDIKDWGYFKPGSYWIYKNSITSNLDSVYVISIREYTESHEADKRTTSINEAIDIKYVSSNQVKLLVTLYSYDVFSLLVSQNDEQNSIKSDFVLFRINSKDEICNYIQEYEVMEKLSSIIINGINYPNILHIKTKVENQYFQPLYSIDYSTHEYWISKNNWIVKKKINNSMVDEEWILIRSKINQ